MQCAVAVAPPHLLRSVTNGWQTLFETPWRKCCTNGVFDGTLYFKSTTVLLVTLHTAGDPSDSARQRSHEARR